MAQIVVAVRWGGAEPSSGTAKEVAAAVGAAMDRASIAGAVLLGVVYDGASFGFEDDGLDEAIELAIALVRDAAPARWKCGVGSGDVERVREEGSFLRLSVGPGMGRAAALARAANRGEVLVDLGIAQAAAGALLAVGRRVASDARKRLRGIILDLDEPWRRDGGEAVERVREPRLVGREAALDALRMVAPGGLGVVRAGPGIGGTRFLEELASRTARSLMVGPIGCSVEPLGALRVAVLRAVERRRRRAAAGQSLPPMSTHASEGTTRLRAGYGVDVVGASEIVAEWLTPELDETETPLLLIDDAMGVDRATLEAIALAATTAGAPFGVVARLDVGEPVPPQLAGLIGEAEVTLKPLQPHEATEVLDDACGGAQAIDAEVRKRWTRRGGGVPLAIVESVRHGLAVGELAVRDGVITPRGRASGRGRTLSPNAWITRRLAALALDRPAEAALATLIAIAGPGLPIARVDEMATGLALPTGERLDDAIARLRREGVLTVHGDRVSPASRTLREAAIERADEATRRPFHAAIAATLAASASGLDLAEGAHHAALAGDHLGAAALGARAADRARKVGLVEWADALAAFARAEGAELAPTMTTPSPPPRQEPSVRAPPLHVTHAMREPTPLPRRAPEPPMPTVPTPPPGAEPAEPPSLRSPLSPAAGRIGTAVARVDAPPEAPAPPRPSAPPFAPLARALGPRIAHVPEGPPSLRMHALNTGEIAALPAPAALAPTTGAADARPANPPPRRPPGPPPRASGMTGLMPAVRATGESPPVELAMREVTPLEDDGAEESPGPSPAAPPSNRPLRDLTADARRALLRGDRPALDTALGQLESLLGPTAASQRLRGLSAVSRGDAGVGLALLRRARADARGEPAIARAGLAYAIALGVVGRSQDALLEALEALALTRRLDDAATATGKQACRAVVERLLHRRGGIVDERVDER